jgi:GH35 family endo-1,4-beta-xylanase
MNEKAKIISQNLLNEDNEINYRINSGIENNRKGFAAIELQDKAGNEIKNAEISFRQLSHEYRFGCNAFMLEQFPEKEKNELYEERFADLFNLAVAPFYWRGLEPEDGELRFKKGCKAIDRRPPIDTIVDFCKKHNITPKGHVLCWHNLLPDWLPKNTQEFEIRLEQRIKKIAERYAGIINIWDVANEAMQWNPLWKHHAQMPEKHVEKSFQIAQKYFPETTELLYNAHPNAAWNNYHGDYSLLYLFGRYMQSQSIPIKGLGLQYHLMGEIDRMVSQEWCNTYCSQRNILANMDQYGKLNLPLNISEITISANHDLGDGDKFQELMAEKLYKIWFSHSSSNGIIWWNLVDGTAYKDTARGWDENVHRAGLLNFDLSPKPAYKALSRLIKEEWNSVGTFKYEFGGINKFQAFYGEYELNIKTNSGSFSHKVHIGKNTDNNFKIETDI